MEKKKKVLTMHFQTKIEHGAHRDENEFSTTGELYEKGGNYYIRFQEELSPTDRVQSTMKWDGEELLLIRQGVILMRQSFTEGKETIGRYVTPEASWETKAMTKALQVILPTNNKEGKIELTYQFSLQGQDTGIHHLILTLKEERSK